MQNIAKKLIFKKIPFFFVFSYLAIFCPRYAKAWGGFFQRSRTMVQSPCLGRLIPYQKTTGIRNLRLECSARSDQFERGAVFLDSTQWQDLYERSFSVQPSDSLRLRQELQQSRQQAEPLLQIKGQIPYEVREVWDWEEWLYSPHESCGYEKKEIQDPATQKRVWVDTMRSCYHSETRHEDLFCTQEALHYQVDFIRPSLSEWNPTIEGYTDLLPNKYDLMPGELETIRISSNLRQSNTLSPYVQIQPAWNAYEVSLHWDQDFSSASVPCATGSKYSLRFNIHTLHRLKDQVTPPTVLALPKDDEGNPLEPLEWLLTVNSEGKIIRSRPDRIRLKDQRVDFLKKVSHEPRVSSSEELGAIETEQTSSQPWKSFYKNTLFRVRLVQKGWNFWMPRILELDASELSEDEFQNKLIPLHGKHSLFEGSTGFFSALLDVLKVLLQPNQDYILYVSTYQKGIPFYAQACSEESPFYWLCKAVISENYWSQEIPIPFHTHQELNEQNIAHDH